MAEYIAYNLRPLVEKLRARYPAVRIVSAELTTIDAGIQQGIRYQAPLAALKQCGLVTADMLRQKDSELGYVGETPIGDGFMLCRRLDSESVPGCWDLTIWTGSAPREYWGIRSMREAAKVLRRIAKSAREPSW